MKKIHSIALTALLLCFTSINAAAQEYEPSVGQAGKDVIWVPTQDSLVEAMLDVAKVTRNDYVIDLGSGDGRIVIAAAKRGARAVGFEFNPDMVALSRRSAEKEGVSDKATFVNADLFESDFSEATVITMYLLPQLNLKLRPTILNLKPGTRIVSHSFTMGEWNPDKTVENQGGTAYLWIVPAKSEGKWTCQTNKGAAELNLVQEFQVLKGTWKSNGGEQPISDGKLDGNRISFVVGRQHYEGLIGNEVIEGTVGTGLTQEKWTAQRNN